MSRFRLHFRVIRHCHSICGLISVDESRRFQKQIAGGWTLIFALEPVGNERGQHKRTSRGIRNLYDPFLSGGFVFRRHLPEWLVSRRRNGKRRKENRRHVLNARFARGIHSRIGRRTGRRLMKNSLNLPVGRLSGTYAWIRNPFQNGYDASLIRDEHLDAFVPNFLPN